MNYEIKYEPFPVLVMDLNNGEEVQCQSGAMSWMSPNMEMQTSTGGGLGKLFGRVFSGEHAFVNKYIAHGNGFIAFSSDFVGKILAVEIKPGQDFVVQKSGYLASYGNVEQSVFFQKKLGAAFFGGTAFSAGAASSSAPLSGMPRQASSMRGNRGGRVSPYSRRMRLRTPCSSI